MIVIAAGWKRCSRCREYKPNGQFFAKTRDANGWPRTRQSACKVCARVRARQVKGYHARKPAPHRTPEERAALQRERHRKIMEEIRADPERLAEWRLRKRLEARARRDRVRGGPPREYPPRATLAGQDVPLAYAPVLHGKGKSPTDVLPAGPITRYLERAFPGWAPGEIAAHIHSAVSPRLIYRLLIERGANVELDAVDRLVTKGLGRPDLLLALYPVEA